jgi:amino acid transporter
MLSTGKTASGMDPGDGRLRRNALPLRHSVSTTLASIAPALSFFFGFAVIAASAGLAAPMTILTAMVGILFLTNTVAQFSRFMPSSGSFVTFTGKAFGPAFGVALSVFLNLGYVTVGSAAICVAGFWTAETLRLFLHISIHWAILATLLSAGTGWVVMRGIVPSAFWSGVFFQFEAGLLILGSILMIATHRHSLTLAPFRFANLTGGLRGLGASFPLAIYLFFGWECAASLAEETEDPRRNIPRALIAGTLSIGIFYVLLAYATEAGFGMNAHALSVAQLPFIDGLRIAAPALLVVAYLAGLTSIVGTMIASVAYQARVIFSCSREGMLPGHFGSVHRRHKTPHRAAWALLLAALVLSLAFGWFGKVGPLNYFGLASTLGTLPIIFTYVFTNLALPVYVVRYHREELDFLRHIVLPAAGTVVMLFPLWGLIQPGQAWPYNLFPWVALAVLIVCGLYGVAIRRRSPGLELQIGSYVADQ